MDDVVTQAPGVAPEQASGWGNATTPWTDELAAEAVKLWREGKSATLIAQALGPAFTRNAVIGKLHRLGLTRAEGYVRAPVTRKRYDTSKRVKAEPPRPSVAPTPSIEARSPVAPDKRSVSGRIADSGIVMRMRRAREEQPTVAPPAPAEPVDLPHEDRPDRLGILELRHRSCRWPLGDPGSPDFGYCGRTSVEGRPYCPEHHGRATRQPTGRTITEEHKRAISVANTKRWNRVRAS